MPHFFRDSIPKYIKYIPLKADSCLIPSGSLGTFRLNTYMRTLYRSVVTTIDTKLGVPGFSPSWKIPSFNPFRAPMLDAVFRKSCVS